NGAEPQESSEYKGKSPRSGRQPFHRANRKFLGYRTLRALGFFRLVNLGFRFAPPQALCFHPLRGFWKRNPAITCSELLEVCLSPKRRRRFALPAHSKSSTSRRNALAAKRFELKTRTRHLEIKRLGLLVLQN